ncbi:MAG: pyruvate dehydrogenase (acetyl-transferring) E1 component subunit alpha [Kofleriaceae bacterium]|jgi:pyruvate dehydrogenase E1 component alpha subunit|nr:pyruvate dehydrogenase (acetyl-transferring) E1 component subunit alpha [Kofleriaceae bacterium]MBP6840761.1 pyruvate dehydrogenase (acetyl-transferring) E1 component subunit alpha [Kofleriaceae bacterium]MBP9208473.1 pyruvate dehydrogenase (acetyl-transferring) E1 component subunit alpha [Kofleriaceae bacterium]
MTTPDTLRVEAQAEPPRTTAQELRPLYRQMLAIRRLEEASAKAYSVGKIGGFLHLIIGQEAVCVGAIAAINNDDYVVCTYRDHGHAYAKGIAARPIMAELYGKKTGLVRGLGGSMHLFDKPTNFLGGHGIVGGHVPLAVGAAFASKYRGDGRVALCFFGEGASTIGGFAEGLALAALWKLPVVLICENNQYSMGTPIERTMAVHDVSMRALAHGMARDRFDGDDVIKVKQRIGEAVARARTTGEPTLVEVVTYRFRGHSMSDPGLYRSKDEVEEWKRRDPLTQTRDRLLALGEPEAALAELEEDVRLEIEDSVRFAEESPAADEYFPYVIKE